MGIALAGGRSGKPGPERAEDEDQEQDGAEAAEEVSGRAAEDGPDGRVAESEGQKEGDEPEEREQSFGVIGPDAPGDVADLVSRKRRLGEGRVLGVCS
jgi:hypothetical protein